MAGLDEGASSAPVRGEGKCEPEPYATVTGGLNRPWGETVKIS